MQKITLILALLGAFGSEVMGRPVSNSDETPLAEPVVRKRQFTFPSPFSNFGQPAGAPTPGLFGGKSSMFESLGIPKLDGSGGTNGMVISTNSQSYDRSASTHDKSSSMISASQDANGQKSLHQEGHTDKGSSQLDLGSSSKMVVSPDGKTIASEDMYDKSSHAHDKATNILSQKENADGSKSIDQMSQSSKGISKLDQSLSRNMALKGDGQAIVSEVSSDKSSHARDNESKIMSQKVEADGKVTYDAKEDKDKGIEKLNKGSSNEVVIAKAS